MTRGGAIKALASAVTVNYEHSGRLRGRKTRGGCPGGTKLVGATRVASMQTKPGNRVTTRPKHHQVETKWSDQTMQTRAENEIRINPLVPDVPYLARSLSVPNMAHSAL